MTVWFGLVSKTNGKNLKFDHRLFYVYSTHKLNTINDFWLQIIGDRRKKSGSYEYGCHFYTPAKKRGAYKLEDQWWFVQNGEIKRKLNDPRIEKVTANRSLYYFDDIEEPKNE